MPNMPPKQSTDAVSSLSDKKLSARGEVARAKLKRAAMTVMEQTGYHGMRIHDVTTEAGVAAGLFYHYFKDLKSLTLEVLSDYIAEARNVDAIEKGVPRGDWYARMHAHFSLVVDSYAQRPGLMRCLLQMADEDKEFADAIRRGYMEQLNWLVQLMPKLFPEAKFDQHQAFLVIYTLASSGEMMLRDYFINLDTRLHQEDIDHAELTELLTTVFYRGLFLENPPADKLCYTKNLQFMKRG
jgi:AcrR family transcriptional regulator